MPNGFEDYVAAGRMTKDDKRVVAVIDAKTRPPVSLAERRHLLAENRPALARLHAGIRQAIFDPAIRSFNDKPTYLAHDRHLARLLWLAADVREAGDDYGAAVNYRLNAMRMGDDIPRGGPIIHGLVGLACDAIGRVWIWQRDLNHLSSAQCQAALRRLLDIDARSYPLTDTIRQEKWSVNGSMAALGPHESSRFSLNPSARRLGEEIGSSLLMVKYNDWMDVLIAAVEKPYYAVRSLPPIPNDWVSRYFGPDYPTLRVKWVDRSAQHALLLTALALRAYRLDHHVYPAALVDLTPAYLLAVPRDPFHDGPLLYRRHGASYVLYSVGPDGQDDGGRPIFAPGEKGHARYYVWPERRGDIVAGINIW